MAEKNSEQHMTEDLIGVLMSISVTSKRLARDLIDVTCADEMETHKQDTSGCCRKGKSCCCCERNC